MKILLRRDQKSAGLMGNKIVYSLAVRAELSEEEKANINKYRLGEEQLYSQKEYGGPTEGIKGLAFALAHRLTNLTINVNDLAKGKVVECKDIMEMLAAEDKIKLAAQNFKAWLEAMAHFGGEEVIEI